MNENNFEYRTQSIDYLGFLSTELRNLRGFATLANELIQNADDAPLVTSLSFDICEDVLIVENNGKFRPEDFERMQNIAAGGKREEAGTTTIRMTINEWSRMMQLHNQDKYELLIVTHASSYEQKFNSVREIIRVRKVWQTLSDIFSKLDCQKVTTAKYGSGIIEFLIGLQQNNSEYSNKENHVLICWKRLIESITHPNIEIYEPLSEDSFLKK